MKKSVLVSCLVASSSRATGDRIFTFDVVRAAAAATTEVETITTKELIECRVRQRIFFFVSSNHHTPTPRHTQVSIFSTSNELITQQYPVQLYVSANNATPSINTILLGDDMKDQQHTMEFDRCTPSHFRLEPNRLLLHDNEPGEIKIHTEHQEPPSTTSYLDTFFKVFLLIIMFLVCTLTTHPDEKKQYQQQQNTNIPLQYIPQTDSEWQHFFDKIYS